MSVPATGSRRGGRSEGKIKQLFECRHRVDRRRNAERNCCRPLNREARKARRFRGGQKVKGWKGRHQEDTRKKS